MLIMVRSALRPRSATLACLTRLLACAVFLCAPAVASAQAALSPYKALQAYDGQLAATGYRLATDNAPLCDRIDAGTGLLFHDIAQYGDRKAIADVFAFATPVEVAAVVPGSPAAAAGILPGDALLSIAVGLRAVKVSDMTGGLDKDAYSRIRKIADVFALAEQDKTIIGLALLRAGQQKSVTLTPLAACATRFQLRTGRGYDAGADGVMVSVDLPLLEYALAAPDGRGEGELAAVVAHELAHNILHHRERLDAVGVNRGIARLLGKNARRIKATEEEADRLSVWLMANAGYDPRDAVRFWTRFGKELGEGIFTEGTHYRWKSRVRQIEDEIAVLAAVPESEDAGGRPADRARVPSILTMPLPSLE